MINEQIYRRFNHTVAACFVIYFLFPEHILGIKREYFIILFWVFLVAIEYLRLNKDLKVLGMRDYEDNRIAGFVWFATGTCLILITPDSERTMCTFLGTAGKINENDVNSDAIKKSEIIFLESICSH